MRSPTEIPGSVIRMIRIGGLSKSELLEELRKNKIQLNESAQILFAHDKFTTMETSTIVETVELSITELGYVEGATSAQINERAATFGLSPCPLELGPHLRLEFLDQPEGYWGNPPSRHRAPPGSITVSSVPLTHDDEFPKGFYLRRIKGELALRGYHAGAEHIWSPEDRLVFCRT